MSVQRVPPRNRPGSGSLPGPGEAGGELASRLFEPFYQVDGSPTRSHGGTGVGLAIVRGVAQGHGGDIRVASPAGEEILGVPFGGAAFYFVVPERVSVAGSDHPPSSQKSVPRQS